MSFLKSFLFCDEKCNRIKCMPFLFLLLLLLTRRMIHISCTIYANSIWITLFSNLPLGTVRVLQWKWMIPKLSILVVTGAIIYGRGYYSMGIISWIDHLKLNPAWQLVDSSLLYITGTPMLYYMSYETHKPHCKWLWVQKDHYDLFHLRL